MWAAQFYTFTKPRSFVSSGGLGTMGYGFPAAVGAQVGRPDKLVIAVSGDGSFQMNIQELGTVAAYNLPVKVVILNNGYLGMVRQWQELFFHRRYYQVDMAVGPDFAKVAEAYGIKGMTIRDYQHVRSGLEEALAHPGPVVVNVMVDREENVFPMVPAGKAIDDMIGLEGGS
jgi:acetolactate synthase-1/2/3 large subunit